MTNREDELGVVSKMMPLDTGAVVVDAPESEVVGKNELDSLDIGELDGCIVACEGSTVMVAVAMVLIHIGASSTVSVIPGVTEYVPGFVTDV